MDLVAAKKKYLDNSTRIQKDIEDFYKRQQDLNLLRQKLANEVIENNKALAVIEELENEAENKV